VSIDPVLSAVVLGFVLGLQHATDPDHLVAVATIVTRERRFLAGARVGLLWGVGHALTLATVGGLVVALNASIPAQLVTGLELLVAVMLIVLGGLRLREAVRGILAVAPERRMADHHHGAGARGWGSLAVWRARSETVHAHHGDPHVHPSAALLAAWADERRRVGLRAFAVGVVHGMAGTAALALLVLATLHTVAAAASYLVVFGLGTIAGMTAFTAAMAYPIARLARLRRLREAMAAVSGVAAIAFGCWYAARLI
jgi:high-affinity nickel-transport protein